MTRGGWRHAGKGDAMSGTGEVVDLARVTHEHFHPHQGSAFILYVAGQAYGMTLNAVTPSKLGTPPGMRHSFSLLFEGPAGEAAPQGNYRVSHEVLGVMELFLVPVGRGSRSKDLDLSLPMLYQAVFG